MNLNISFIRELFIPVLTASTALFVAKHNIYTPRKLKVIESQFYKVYLPLFKIVEINIYKKIEQNTALNYSKQMLKIAHQNYELINPELYHWIKRFTLKVNTNKPYSYEFDIICSYIDKYYEKLKKPLYLPKRNFIYRFSNNQFKYQTRTLINNLLKTIFEGLFLISFSLLASLTIRFMINFFKFLSSNFIK